MVTLAATIIVFYVTAVTSKPIVLLTTVCLLYTVVVSGTCSYGNIRLYNGSASSNTSGMLQICSTTGQWVAVCDYGWGQNSSIVVCKQLGYTNPCKPIKQQCTRLQLYTCCITHVCSYYVMYMCTVYYMR